MSWNYRIVDDHGIFQLHEVYYDNGTIIAWSENAITPMGETKSALLSDLEYMGEAFRKAVLKIEDLPGQSAL